MELQRLWPKALLGTIVACASSLTLLAFLAQVGRTHGAWHALREFFISHPPWIDTLLAIVAIGFAVIQFVHSRWQHSGLRYITKSVSTVFTGSFPRHLTAITEVISTANDSISALADCVDYGSFFDPRAHERVFVSIARAVLEKKIEVRVLVCGTPQPITHNSPFFGQNLAESLESHKFREHLTAYIAFVSGDEDFKKWIAGSRSDANLKSWVDKCLRFMSGSAPSRVFEERLQRCVDVCSGGPSFVAQEDEDFKTLLLLRQKWFGERLKCIGVKVLEHQRDEAVFFWLKDEEVDAVFVFADSGDKTRGLGFRTHDSDLLKIFESIFSKRWAQANGEDQPQVRKPEHEAV